MALTFEQKDTMSASQDKNITPACEPSLLGIMRSHSLIELEAWLPSKIGAISPTVEQLMQFMKPWRCIDGNEFAVEIAGEPKFECGNPRRRLRVAPKQLFLEADRAPENAANLFPQVSERINVFSGHSPDLVEVR